MTRSLISVAILLAGTAMASAAAVPIPQAEPTALKTAATVAPAEADTLKPLAGLQDVAGSARDGAFAPVDMAAVLPVQSKK